MKVEIVEFYETKRTEDGGVLWGTTHAYLIDFDMDLRGCPTKKIHDKVFIQLPALTSWDPEAKKYITYPTISFTDKEKNRKLVKTLQVECKKYFKKRDKEKTS